VASTVATANAAASWGELEVAGMHELGTGTANDMFQNIGAQRVETVSDETLPAGVFPLRMFQSIHDRQQHEALDYRRLPLPRRSPISLNWTSQGLSTEPTSG